MAAQMLHIYQTNKKSYFRYLDDDSKGPDGELLKWVQDLVAQAQNAGVKMPFLVVGDGSRGVGKTIALVPFPIGVGGAVKVLKKYGG